MPIENRVNLVCPQCGAIVAQRVGRSWVVADVAVEVAVTGAIRCSCGAEVSLPELPLLGNPPKYETRSPHL